ncbi:MAG: DNA polymerase III subunit delta [Candidatus Nealsonbacteria bacterium]
MPKMIIFLYGQDTYRLRRKTKEIVGHYEKTHKSGINLKHFEGKKFDFNDFKNELQITSMFKEKKLVILEDVFSNQEFKESFLEYSKKFIKSDNIILFYEINKISQKDPLFVFLKKNAKVQEFKPLEGQSLNIWLKKELKDRQIKIESKALEKIIEYAGNNLWQVFNEVEKLANFKKGESVEAKDVELLVKPKVEIDIFKTIDAIASKNKKEALSLIQKHLSRGDSCLYLLYMINYQFRNLLIVKDLLEKNISYFSASKASGLHPFVFKKSCLQAERFTIQDLKKIYQKIFQIDFDVKTGKIDPQTALDLLITEV